MNDLDQAIKTVTDAIENLNRLVDEKNLAIEDIADTYFQSLRGPPGVTGPSGPGLTTPWLIKTFKEMSVKDIQQIREALLLD
jgi:hypothetical protein